MVIRARNPHSAEFYSGISLSDIPFQDNNHPFLRKTYFPNEISIQLTFVLTLVACLSAFSQDKIGIVKHNHIALQVADIQVSAKFYGEVLQLDRIEVPDNLKAIRAWFKIGTDQQIHLLAGRTQPVVNDRNGSHFAVFVSSMGKAEAYLTKLKLPFHKQVRFDGVVQIYLADPDGYLVELNEWK
jgi:catechol 2,3-dioxygenase-like lactoylglutathione lyase family enzyme